MSNITETKYDELCENCDALLYENITNPNRISNNWLHIIRIHPTFLSNYEYILKKKNSMHFCFFLFKRICYYIGSIFYRITLICSKFFFGKKNSNTENFECESIYISHLLKPNLLNKKEDFYFHKLPDRFQDSKKKSLILYINHSNISSTKLNHQNKNSNKIVLSKNLSIYKEIQISFYLFSEAIKLLATKGPKEINNRVKSQAIVEFLSPSSHSNLRIGHQVKEIIRKVKPKYVFTTYEGHPWERLVYFFSKSQNHKIKTIGYQHAFVFNKQHAIKRVLGKKYNPDFILCSGNDGKKKLVSANFLNKEKIFVFGTNRALSKKINFKSKKLRNTFLLLPEGDFRECITFIDFAIELSKLHKDKFFIIRFHPITNINKLKNKRPELINLPENITISEKLYEDDLKCADFAIYRGTTSIIKAIENGLIPIYYHKKGGQNIDPLFSLSKHKKSIKDFKDIYDVVNINEDENIKNLIALNSGIKEFFSPLNYNEALKLKKLN